MTDGTHETRAATVSHLCLRAIRLCAGVDRFLVPISEKCARLVTFEAQVNLHSSSAPETA